MHLAKLVVRIKPESGCYKALYVIVDSTVGGSFRIRANQVWWLHRRTKLLNQKGFNASLSCRRSEVCVPGSGGSFMTSSASQAASGFATCDLMLMTPNGI